MAVQEYRRPHNLVRQVRRRSQVTRVPFKCRETFEDTTLISTWVAAWAAARLSRHLFGASNRYGVVGYPCTQQVLTAYGSQTLSNRRFRIYAGAQILFGPSFEPTLSSRRYFCLPMRPFASFCLEMLSSAELSTARGSGSNTASR
jgi:hypothetical protein